MELNATSVATAVNILSLINLLGDSSITSTSQSAAFPQAFSALLTEMMGPNATQISVPSAALPVQVDTPSVSVNAHKSELRAKPTPTEAMNPAVVVASAPQAVNFGEPEKSIVLEVYDRAFSMDSTT